MQQSLAAVWEVKVGHSFTDTSERAAVVKQGRQWMRSGSSICTYKAVNYFLIVSQLLCFKTHLNTCTPLHTSLQKLQHCWILCEFSWSGGLIMVCMCVASTCSSHRHRQKPNLTAVICFLKVLIANCYWLKLMFKKIRKKQAEARVSVNNDTATHFFRGSWVTTEREFFFLYTLFFFRKYLLK